MSKTRRRQNYVSGSGRVKIAKILAAGYQPTRRTRRDIARAGRAE